MDRTVGFIGLGNMGWNMASHLARSGYEVLGYDAKADTMERFANETGSRVPALADLAEASLIWTMLPTGQVVREVLTGGGERSLARSLRPGTLMIDTTSSPPELTRSLGALLAEAGVSLMDAGVSGGHRGAIEGNLVFMVGCDDEALFERAQKPFSTMSRNIFRLGPLGSGHTMKSLNNFVSAACFSATCEAMILGERLGLDPAALTEVLKVSTGSNDAVTRTIPKILDGSFRKTFSLGLFTKDIRIAEELAAGAGAAAPLVSLVHRRMAEALAAYGPDVDHSFAFKHWRAGMSGTPPDNEAP